MDLWKRFNLEMCVFGTFRRSEFRYSTLYFYVQLTPCPHLRLELHSNTCFQFSQQGLHSFIFCFVVYNKKRDVKTNILSMSFLNKKFLVSILAVRIGFERSFFEERFFGGRRQYRYYFKFRFRALPAGAVSDGEIIKDSVVIDAIHNLLEKSGPKKIPTRQVVCSLPEVKSFLRIINLPMMDDRKRKRR